MEDEQEVSDSKLTVDMEIQTTEETVVVDDTHIEEDKMTLEDENQEQHTIESHFNKYFISIAIFVVTFLFVYYSLL